MKNSNILNENSGNMSTVNKDSKKIISTFKTQAISEVCDIVKSTPIVSENSVEDAKLFIEENKK